MSVVDADVTFAENPTKMKGPDSKFVQAERKQHLDERVLEGA